MRLSRFFSAAIVLLVTAGACLADDAKADKPAPKTKKVEAGKITITVPESWKRKDSTQMRLAQFDVPAADGDKEPGEFVVFYFGPQGAGGLDANIERWVGQLEEEGRRVKIVSGESELGKYTLVDLTGTYNKSIGPPIAKKTKRLPEWRVLNVMIETKSGPYFLKLDGPETTIAGVEKEFRASFGAKQDAEKERTKD